MDKEALLAEFMEHMRCRDVAAAEITADDLTLKQRQAASVNWTFWGEYYVRRIWDSV